MCDDSEVKRAIYQHDCEQYRYEEGLRWSRFQTAALVEGAMLYGLYSNGVISLRAFERLVWGLLGCVMVCLICILAAKDATDAQSHMDRISHFEKANPFPKRPWPKALKGNPVMWYLIALINLFNALLLLKLAAA